MNKIIAIYHKSDYDGIFCREIARKFLPEAELIGWEYGEPTPDVPSGSQLYILDLSVPDLMNHPRLIWIDHHKTAIDKYSTAIPGYRIDGVAACRLAWQWFTMVDGNTNYGNVGNSVRAAGVLPMVQDYKNRQVNEPWAVRLAGEYDIWDKRDPNAELFQHGLRSCDLEEGGGWAALLMPDHLSTNYVGLLLDKGKALQYAKTKENESIIKAQGFRLKWEGLNFLCCNHARFNSFLFMAALNEFDDACLGFCWDGKKWKVSLYHAPGKEGHDLSVIAAEHGGGGHRGACGFTCDTLPFKLG